MAVAGIIAEYNPFHRGHAWQIDEVRKTLGDDTAVVVAMSGNFVQRGDFAAFSKHARAEMALAGGADLILELPTPWASAGAERFAQGGTALLSATGTVTHLAFGCECGDSAPLLSAVLAQEREEYPELLRKHLAAGMTFAAARQAAVEELAGDAARCLALPNNALAVEYLRSLRAISSSIEPLAIRRIGAAHDSEELGIYSSASAIRKELLSGGNWCSLVSEETAAIAQREIKAGRAPVSAKNCERAILAALRSMKAEDFLPYDGGSEGLYRRFYAAVRSGCSIEDILTAVKTKRYPLARLRRMLLHSYLKQPPAAQSETPRYIRVLGANERGRTLLARMRKTAALPVITKPAQVRKLGGEAERAFIRESELTDLYVLAMPDLSSAAPDSDFTHAAIMPDLKKERTAP